MKENSSRSIDADVGEPVAVTPIGAQARRGDVGGVAAGLRMAPSRSPSPPSRATPSRQGGCPAAVVNVLNFALTLEYLEAEFYNTGVAHVGTHSGRRSADLHHDPGARERARDSFCMTDAGQRRRSEADLRLHGGERSGNGPYAGVFTNYDTSRRSRRRSRTRESARTRGRRGAGSRIRACSPRR